MSCKVRGGLKSGNRAGVCKKRVHFIDEAQVSISVVTEKVLQTGDRAQTQAKACDFTREPPGLDEIFSKVAVSCDTPDTQAAASLMQKGGRLQEDQLCHIAEEKINTIEESKKAALSCGVDDVNHMIENESLSTPPTCASYVGLSSPKAEPRSHSQIHINSHVQRKLTFRVNSREQCHTKFGLTSKNSSHNYYKVVPEAEEGTLPANYLMSQHDPTGRLSQEACKKRCAWITPYSDPVYVAYHDEEWGVPAHEDRRLFELLVFAGAQAEIAWSPLVAKREAYRNLFAQFDPSILASYDATKMASLRSHSDIMRSEARVQSIVSNAKLVMKIVEEYGSFDAYLWGFVSNRPIVNRYRQPNLIPVRSGKSEAISKDLQRRGFRHAGPIVVYSLMQAAGLANDHLLSCFRHHDLLLPPQLSSSPSPHEALLRKPSAARKPLVVSPLCC